MTYILLLFLWVGTGVTTTTDYVANLLLESDTVITDAKIDSAGTLWYSTMLGRIYSNGVMKLDLNIQVPEKTGGLTSFTFVDEHIYAFATITESGRMQANVFKAVSPLEITRIFTSAVRSRTGHANGFIIAPEQKELIFGFGDDTSNSVKAAAYITETQDVNLVFGKIMRTDLDGKGLSYNPFCNGSLDELQCKIYAYGFRNPWSALWISPTLWVGDVGFNKVEEVNEVVPGNYGWPCYEGTIPRNNYLHYCPSLPLLPPKYQYYHPMGSAIVGIGQINSELYVADYSGWIMRLPSYDMIATFEDKIFRMIPGTDSLLVITYNRVTKKAKIFELKVVPNSYQYRWLFPCILS